MNKKVIGGSLLAIILATVFFFSLDRRSEEEKWLDAISWFIYEQTGEFEEYDALELFEITNDMLLQDVQLREQLTVVQDSVRQKASLLDAHGKLPKSWNRELASFQEILPDQIDDYLKFNAKMNLALSTIEDSDRKANITFREKGALALIEAKLEALNLSIFSIDLSGEESQYFIHRFALDGKVSLSVFEIDAESKEVISFKNIG